MVTVLDDGSLTRLLIDANPARTPKDAEPDAAAFRMRERIVRGPVGVPPAKARAPRVAWASGLTAAAAAGVVVFGLVTPAGQAVAVTPAPLVFTDAGSTQQIVDRSIALLSDGAVTEPEREVESATWALSVEVDEQQMAVTPQFSTLVWNEDLSGSVRTVAGEEYWPDRSRRSDAEVVATDEVLFELTMAPGEFATPVVTAPGESVDDVLAMLSAYGLPDDPSAAQLIDSMVTALDQWTLTDAQHAALLELIEAENAVTVLGESTDRLGRPVYALNVPAAGGAAEQTVLISAESGRIVGVESEQSRTDGIIPEGAVVMYNLWF